MAKCVNCPVKNGPCRAEVDGRFGFFCEMAESGEPSQLASIKAVSEQTPPPANNYPSLLTQVGNFASSMVDFAKDGFKLSDTELAASRQEVCNNCPSYDRELGKCRQCGCGISAKVKIRSSSCPLGKW